MQNDLEWGRVEDLEALGALGGFCSPLVMKRRSKKIVI